jgi:hypothetical protein
MVSACTELRQAFISMPNKEYHGSFEKKKPLNCRLEVIKSALNCPVNDAGKNATTRDVF